MGYFIGFIVRGNDSSCNIYRLKFNFRVFAFWAFDLVFRVWVIYTVRVRVRDKVKVRVWHFLRFSVLGFMIFGLKSIV